MPKITSRHAMEQRLVDLCWSLWTELGVAGVIRHHATWNIDPEALIVAPGTSLSRASEARLPLTWITLLHGRIGASLAATTGVEGSTEVIKYLLAGADVVMTASALLRHGPEYAVVILDGLREWMGRKGYTAVDDFRGLLAVPVGVDETARERGEYVNALRKANSSGSGSW